MEDKKDKKLLYGAILAGFLAFVLNFIYVASMEEPVGTKLVMARNDISSGGSITETDTVHVTVLGNISATAGGRYLSVLEFELLKGKIAQRDIVRGELITRNAVGLSAADLNISDLKPHERLVAIQVDEGSSIGYRLSRGDRIDIYKVGDDQPQLVLESVKIAAVGVEAQRSQASGSMYRTVVLRVSKNNARKILAAKGSGGNSFGIILGPRKDG